MARDTESFQSSTGMAEQTAEQITKQTQGAMEHYFGWLQNTMSASPWGNTDLNKKLLSYATQNVTAAFTFGQKLSHAKDSKKWVGFRSNSRCRWINTFGEQTKSLADAYQGQQQL